MALRDIQPIPVPTPYQSPQYGGNPNITPGTTGQSIAAKDYPIQTLMDGRIRWASGKITGQGSVTTQVSTRQTTPTIQPTKQPSQPQVQPQAQPSQPSGGSTWDQISKYYAGWNSDQAMKDFAEAYGGDYNRLRQSRGDFTYDERARMEEDRKRQAEELEENRKRQAEERTREAITAAYKPVYAELDRQIGLAPEQEQELKDLISTLTTPQTKTIETERAKGERYLEAAKTEEEAAGRKGLRGLEEDIRSQMLARNIYFGSLGAGASSAPMMASDILGRAGLKAKGSVIEATNKALSNIRLKAQDVNDLASTQLNKVEEWKNGKLFEIAQTFQNRINDLNTAKANTSAEEGQAIANLIQNTEQQFIARLQELDDEVTQHRQAIDSWQMQRQGDLQDYERKLQLASQYTPTVASTVKDKQWQLREDALGRQVYWNPYTLEEKPVGIISTETKEEDEDKGFLGGLRDVFNAFTTL